MVHYLADSTNSLERVLVSDGCSFCQTMCSAQCIDLSNQNIGTDGTTLLLSIVSANVMLHELRLDGVYMHEDQLSILCKAIELSSVAILRMVDCQLGPGGTLILSSVLSNNSEITDLSLDRNQLVTVTQEKDTVGPAAAVDLRGFVAMCKGLRLSKVRKLSLSDCNLGPESISELARHIPYLRALVTINLDGNKITGSTS
eukprot:SAG31_NODE_15723_length_741_cov_1.205607_2_plen_199_part_01